MRPTGCLETSVRNCLYSLYNSSEERGVYLLLSGSLESSSVKQFLFKRQTLYQQEKDMAGFIMWDAIGTLLNLFFTTSNFINFESFFKLFLRFV
jgi:hypothetical protein